MNNSILIAVAIVAAAIIQLPIGPAPGRFQIATGQGGTVRLDTATQGDAWAANTALGPWMSFRDNGARP